MRNTGGSGRSKSSKDKTQTNNTSTYKSDVLPAKSIQPTAEQVALTNLINKDTDGHDADLQKKIEQIIELTGCSQETAQIALYDNKNDLDTAVNFLFEGKADEGEWRETGKKKKKQSKTETTVTENNADSKPEKRDHKERNDKDNRDRDRDDGDNERNFRDQNDNFRRNRRSDNRPPRLSRGRGRPDRGGDRSENREDESNDREDLRDRGGFERGRGRGRGFGGGSRRGGRGGGSGSTGGDRNFRSIPSRFEKNSNFDNGPQIDTWTNDISVIGEKEPKISSWGDSKEDWNEDIDSWTGSLAETKVFTASTVSSSDPPNTVQLDSNTFDLTSVLYSQKQSQNDMNAEANYINQFNQQATESIKNTIGIGSGSTSSMQNSMSSQTASNVSALMNIQNVLHPDSMGATEMAGNSLSGSALTGNGYVGTSLGNPLTSTNQGLSNLAGNVLSGNVVISGSSVAQSLAAVPSGHPTSTVAQSAMLQQQRQKPQRSKLPPPSKIPASAVEMPGHKMTALDVQFGNLEFGTDSSPFTFGGNESASNAFSSAASSSTPTINNHVTAGVGQVALSKTNTESMIPSTIMSATLEQTSPRTSGIYQQSPYTTPTKQNSAENAGKVHYTPEPLQMPGNTDLKSSQLMSGQPSQGYQSHKQSTGFSSKPGSYPGNQSGSNPNQSSSSQYSSQYSQRSGQNQYQNSGSSQYPSSSPYVSSSSGYSSSQAGYQSSQQQQQQQQFPTNQSQFPQNQNQFQNFQSGSTFQNQSFQSNQSSVTNSLYTTTASSYSGGSQPNSLYSQGSSHTGSYANQFLNRDHASGAGASYQASVTQASSPFKDNQSGTSSYRDSSSNKSRETPQSDSAYSRDTHSASSYSDNQSMAYNRDSQSVGSGYTRDSSNTYKRDSTKSASGGSYPRDSQQNSDSASGFSHTRDTQLSAQYSGRDNQSFKDSQSGFRDTSAGASTYANQAGSYPRDSAQTGLGAGASQAPAGFASKNFRQSTDLNTSTHQNQSLPGSKVADSFSKVKDGAGLENHSTVTSQFDATNPSSVTKSSSSSTQSLISNTTTLTTSSASVTTVTSSNTTKISTLPTSSSKAPPNPPPGVPLMTQQYIMGQANTLPFYGLQGLQGLQQPLYANIDDFQFLQQRNMPPLANNVYDMSNAAAGLPLPSTSHNSTQQTVPNVPYSGSADSTKLTRVDAQSPTGTVSTSQQQSATGQTHQQPQPPYILNYGYYYPPSLIPGAGFQYPMIPMPQVTNAAAAHGGSPVNSQYQQKNYGSHHIPYGTTKMYDDLNQPSQDFNKPPYGSSQTQQQKANSNTSVTGGSVSADIQVPGYGKTHAQAFDKQGVHAGTPPSFNLQMPPGQLATGTQAGPLGAHAGPYAGPFMPMMQPHSQMMHHPLQDSSTSSRGGQQTGSHSGSKSGSKAYSTTNWSY